ncbi:lipopolysaccharide biosynthesis protein [Prosthecodimorpha staleyi]|uniref:Polysaccharide biosynthesis protein n=1 Tax=Prosthecodimorpha staleyi TaxID=2840188 RepID=A0A947D1D2_9HYPH|nr:hypothetical protein [Prosthecodimorpha staleyi]MBT9288473.1 hypothetical protein [Prosthecodimorpha staleyi]
MTAPSRPALWRRLAAGLSAPVGASAEAARAHERHRRIVLSALASAVGRAISIAAALISVPLTLHYLGAERYGMWMIMSSFVAILGFADLGVGNGVLTMVARLNGKDSFDGIRTVVSSAVAILVILAGVLAGAFVLAYPRIDWFRLFNVSTDLARSEAGPAVAVFAACFLAAFPLSIVQKVQTGLQQGFTVSLWQSGGNLLGLAAVLAVVRLEGGLPWLVAALFGIPQVAVAGNAVWFFLFRRPDLRPSLRRVQGAVMAGVLSTGFLFLVLQSVVAVTYSSDSLIIAHLLGPAAVADFAVPEKLFAALSAVLGMITAPLWPAFGEAIARGDRAWASRMLRRSILANVCIALTGSLVLVVTGPWIIEAWVGRAVAPSLLLLVGFAVWKVCEAAGAPIAMLLNGAHRVGPQIVFASTTAVVAILLKVALIGQFGVSGAIWATSAAFLVFALLPLGLVASRVLRD